MPFMRMSWAWLPFSITLPLSKTNISSASRTVLKRCAITKVVRPVRCQWDACTLFFFLFFFFFFFLLCLFLFLIFFLLLLLLLHFLLLLLLLFIFFFFSSSSSFLLLHTYLAERCPELFVRSSRSHCPRHL